MKPQSKNNQNLLFPVNYLKNHQETTMKKASGTSQFALFTLNLPENLRSTFRKNRLSTNSFLRFGRNFLVPGGLILTKVLKKAIIAMGWLFAPVLHFLSYLNDGIGNKFSIVAEEFFRFMDSFVMMDIENLELAVISDLSTESVAADKRVTGSSFSNRPLRKQAISSFKFSVRESSKVDSLPDLSIYQSEKRSPGQRQQRLKEVFSKSSEACNSRKSPFNRPELLTPKPIHTYQLKLPLKPLLTKFSSLTRMLRPSFFGRIFPLADLVFVTKHIQKS